MPAIETTLRDSWSTPDEFIEALMRFVSEPPCIDVCATEENTKMDYYFSIEHDALNTDWVASALDYDLNPVFWCNPGYSNLTPWVEAAIEATRDGGVTYLLTHDNYNSKWFKVLYDSQCCSNTFLLLPRISFIPAPGIHESSPRGNNMLHVIQEGVRPYMFPTITATNWKNW